MLKNRLTILKNNALLKPVSYDLWFIRFFFWFADIGEGVEDFETLESLSKSLNDPKNIRNYKSYSGVDLAEGELCLVKTLDSSCREHWKRAIVLESFEKSYEVRV